jgi:tRNA-dihydrouridine synthase B
MKIGTLSLSSRLIAAPMAGVVDVSARILFRRYGAALVFTEMVSAEGIVREGRGSLSLISCDVREAPLGVQLFGRDPLVFGRAAAYAERRGAALIDINMGCPVRRIVRQGAGAALLTEPDLCARIVAEVRRAVTVPVTAKIRAGPDSSSIIYDKVGRMLQDAGADAVILHPRTADKFFSGTADWSLVKELAAQLSIPVVGSGDVKTHAQADERIRESNAAFVMIGRGAMGRPWVFAPDGASPKPSELGRIIESHRALIEELYPAKKAVSVFKRHCAYYLKGLPGAAGLRAGVMERTTTADVMVLVDDHLSRETRDIYAADDGVAGS